MRTKTDQRIIKTQAKLRQAFADMMKVMPFEEITVFDLCDKAKIRRATFYKHFKDKYDFLSYIVSLLQDEIVEKLNSIKSHRAPIEYYTDYVNLILEYLDEHEDIIQHILSSEIFHTMLNIILDRTLTSFLHDLKNDIKNGYSIPADIEITAAFLNGGISHVIVNWLESGKTTEKEAVIKQLKQLLNRIMI